MDATKKLDRIHPKDFRKDHDPIYFTDSRQEYVLVFCMIDAIRNLFGVPWLLDYGNNTVLEMLEGRNKRFGTKVYIPTDNPDVSVDSEHGGIYLACRTARAAIQCLRGINRWMADVEKDAAEFHAILKKYQ